MEAVEHLNAFCVLFQQLESVCVKSADQVTSESARVIRQQMRQHYRFLNSGMIKYLDQFTRKLISFGWNFSESVDIPKVSVADLDASTAVNVKGDFKFTSKATETENGAQFNYNEFSTPLSKLSDNDFNIIKQKTIQNIKVEQQMMATHQRPKQQSQQRTWGITDAEKSW